MCGCKSKCFGIGVPSRSINTARTFLTFCVDLPFKSVWFGQKKTPAPFLFKFHSVLKCFFNDPCNSLINL